MAQYQFKASGVHRETGQYEKIDRFLHATDNRAAMETVAVDFAPSVRDEYSSVPHLELTSIDDGNTVVGVFDMATKKWLVGNVHHDDRPVFGGYSRNELSPAFDRVRDPKNWKNPIDKVMPPDIDQDLVGAAIAFFAGSEAHFEPTAEGIRVTAPGYYADIGS